MANPLRIAFIDEAYADLAQVGRVLSELDRGLGRADVQQLGACYRLLHTLSGLAGHLGLASIQALAQTVEHVLEDMRRNRQFRSAARIEAVQIAVHRLIELVQGLSENTAVSALEQDVCTLIRDLKCLTKHATMGRYAQHRCHDRIPAWHVRLGGQVTTGPPQRAAPRMTLHER